MARSALFAGLALATMPLTIGGCMSTDLHPTTSRRGPSASTLPPPGLNHIYVVLDAATYAAFRDSREVADLLGRSDGGLPDYAPPASGADRIFFRGRQTYLELFAPGNRFGEPVGKVGVALGYDLPGRFEALEQKWRDTCGDEARRSQVSYQRIQPPVPWYEALQCDGTAAGAELAVWAMVYQPEFYQWQSGGRPHPRRRTARRDILKARAAAGQGKFDITALALEVRAPLYARLVQQFEAAGFARHDLPGGTRLRGDGWELLLRPVGEAPARVSLTLATDAMPGEDLRLGSATVTRHRGGVRLHFGQAQASR